MPEGWRISIFLGRGAHVPLDDLCMRMEGDRIVLAGDLIDAEIMASSMGELHYFAHEKQIGFPVIVTTYPGAVIKFWWLYDEYGKPEAGASKPIHWIEDTLHFAAMTCAEYAEVLMMDKLDQQMQEYPETAEWYYDEVLEWMMDEFERTSLHAAMVSIQTIPSDAEKDTYETRLIAFHDGSSVVVGGDGWRAQSKAVIIVPKPGGVGRERLYKQVLVQAQSSNWYQ